MTLRNKSFGFGVSSLLCLFFLDGRTAKKDQDFLEFGTTILAYVSQDSIWFASDTKIAYLSKDFIHDERATYNSKVYLANGIFFGFTGISYAESKGKPYFDAKNIVSRILKRESNLQKAFPVIHDSMMAYLQRLADSMVSLKYTNTIKDRLNKTLLDITLATFTKNGKPDYAYRCYNLINAGTRLTIETAKTFLNDGDDAFLFSGYTDVLKSYLIKNSGYFKPTTHKGFNKVQKLACLIKMEADSNPKYVGMPCEVVVIYKGGHKWIKNIKDCRIKM